MQAVSMPNVRGTLFQLVNVRVLVKGDHLLSRALDAAASRRFLFIFRRSVVALRGFPREHDALHKALDKPLI